MFFFTRIKTLFDEVVKIWLLYSNFFWNYVSIKICSEIFFKVASFFSLLTCCPQIAQIAFWVSDVAIGSFLQFNELEFPLMNFLNLKYFKISFCKQKTLQQRPRIERDFLPMLQEINSSVRFSPFTTRDSITLRIYEYIQMKKETKWIAFLYD